MSGSSKDGDAQSSEPVTCDTPAAGHAAASAAKHKKAPSPRNCREFIRRKTANAMPDIVDAFVVKAKGGSVAHFNALTKVGGFDQRSGTSDAPKSRRRSLARQLLDEVERYEALQAAELAEATAAASQVGSVQIDNARRDKAGPQERS